MCDRGGFRVILDLKSFFEDRRKRCFYYVDLNNHKTVRDVHRGIQERFNIRNNIHLELKDSLLPVFENVRVLHEDDVIDVIDSGESKCLERSRSCEDLAVLYEEATKKKKRKRKREDHVNEVSLADNSILTNGTTSTCNDKLSDETIETESFASKSGKVRKKETKLAEDLSESKIIHLSESKSVESLNCVVEKKMKSLTANGLAPVIEQPEMKCLQKEEIADECVEQSEDSLSASLSNISCGIVLPISVVNEVKTENDNDQQQENENSGTKKRRRRRRRNKTKNNDNNHFKSTVEFVPEKYSFSTNQTSQNGPKHIKFTEDGNDNICISNVDDEAANQSSISFEVLKHSLEHSTNITSNEAVNTSSNSKDLKPVSESKVETNCSVVQNTPLKTSCKTSTPLIFVCKRTKQLDSGYLKDAKQETAFSQYPLLNTSPKVNDIIAFKKWKMDDSYCPSISGYINAKVLRLSESDGLITLKIIDGHSELREPKGKFSLDREPEDESEPVIEKPIETIDLNISELLDIRLVYP